MTATLPEAASLSRVQLGVVRGFSYGLYDAPDEFMHHVHALGSRTARVFLYWSQIEPEPGKYDWDALDTFLGQLDDTDEAWVVICASSPWATQTSTRMLPPSPAKDMQQYRDFVEKLIERSAGKVRIWQCENEPHMPPVWAGSASEYLEHMRVFWDAVQKYSPGSLVALGGAPPNAIPLGLPIKQDPRPLEFFDEVLREGADYYDIFDLHLYGDLYSIPYVIGKCREYMRSFGYEKPIVIGEYNGPVPLEFHELKDTIFDAMAPLREQARCEETVHGPETLEPQGPDEPAMTALYERWDELPGQLQMFMEGCSPELEAKRERWNCRDLVMRNMLALSSGVYRTLCWQLAFDMAEKMTPHRSVHLLFAKLVLMEYDGERIGRRRRTGETFELLARHVEGAREVRRVPVPDEPDVFLFEVVRDDSGPLFVAWEKRDGFAAEDLPARELLWDWPAPAAKATDVFGESVAVPVRDGKAAIPLSLTPVFVEG